ncbi:TPM domain-containing protein [Chitinolyticbacter meiyuanensis]|uniref:TPM domain-containing protein n=1 Tax=Chitinolyticbacter meiyuanensis TaxID=682798 RepID=UPI001652459A|nr:TPM domain-containing protein [Chitinolyticbacter meiyuanensis]
MDQRRLWLNLKPCLASRHFDDTSMAQLEAAIAAAESGHRGELRLVVERRLPLAAAWHGLAVRDRAVQWFSDLHVWDTEYNTGVLLYLLLSERRIELIADRGIAGAVPDAQWQAICADLIGALAANRYVEGVQQAINQLGGLLATHRPLEANAADRDELPNRPVIR